ncbi:hypothetical protein PR048_000447 [Dryococelus australis]|uniref:Integrase catalytic domain-containing protein n=1 Tax=Dryococelus australis TaxID=614101 RepID=A0ABQ9IEN0_9NEOP|nr:hypothetical protein PR048_000447 [Dryococelus australis]
MVHTSLRHPQANLVERVNRNYKIALRSFQSDTPRHWDDVLYVIMHQLRCFLGWRLMHLLKNMWSLHGICLENVNSKILEEIWADVTRNLFAHHQKMEHKSNLAYKDVTLKPGDLILVEAHHLSSKIDYFSAKLSVKWHGPFQIVRFLSPMTVLIEDLHSPNKYEKVHISQCKRYHGRRDVTAIPGHRTKIKPTVQYEFEKMLAVWNGLPSLRRGSTPHVRWAGRLVCKYGRRGAAAPHESMTAFPSVIRNLDHVTPASKSRTTRGFVTTNLDHATTAILDDITTAILDYITLSCVIPGSDVARISRRMDDLGGSARCFLAVASLGASRAATNLPGQGPAVKLAPDLYRVAASKSHRHPPHDDNATRQFTALRLVTMTCMMRVKVSPYCSHGYPPHKRIQLDGALKETTLRNSCAVINPSNKIISCEWSREIWAALDIEVFRADEGEVTAAPECDNGENGRTLRKTRLPAACDDPEATPPHFLIPRGHEDVALTSSARWGKQASNATLLCRRTRALKLRRVMIACHNSGMRKVGDLVGRSSYTKDDADRSRCYRAQPFSAFITVGHVTLCRIGVGQCWAHAQKTNKRSTSCRSCVQDLARTVTG